MRTATKMLGSVVLLGVLACQAPEQEAQQSSKRATPGAGFLISDQNHNHGTRGFFFLPPMVPSSTYGSTFQPGLSPVVKIDEMSTAGATTTGVGLATYTKSSGPGGVTVKEGTDHYAVNWDTKQFGLNAAVTYRIRVLLGDRELGFADVDVVDSGNQLRNVNGDQYIPLLDDRTLPIKFRIEPEAVGPDLCKGVACAPLDQCHVAGVCDPTSGICSNPIIPDGTLCSDGSTCTQTDACRAGVCVGTSPALAAPTEVVDAPPNVNQVVLSWTPVAAAASYDVWRDGTLVTPAGTVSPVFTDTGLGDGETHVYTVTATDCLGQRSQPSAQYAASTRTAAPVLVSSGMPDRIALSWTKPGGVQTFDLQRASPTCADAFATLPGAAGLLATTNRFEDFSAAAGAAYCYRVISANPGGQSPSQPTAAQRVGPPPAPAILVGTPGDRRVDLAWDPVIAPFLAGYRVYRDGVALPPDVPASTTVYSDVDSALINGIAYTYFVRAVDTAGQESGNSNSITQTPSAVPARGLAWAKLEGGAGSDALASLAAFPDDSVVAAGSFQGTTILSPAEPNATTLSAATGDTGAFVARYGGDGALAWARQAATLLPAGVHQATGVAVLPGDAGLVAVGSHHGTSTNPLDFGDGHTLAVPDGGSGQDFFAVHYSSAGTVSWVQGSQYFDIGSAVKAVGVAALPDRGAIVAGGFRGTPTIGGSPLDSGGASADDTMVVRLTPGGDIGWVATATNGTGDASTPFAVASFPNGSSVVLGHYLGSPAFGSMTLPSTVAGRLFLVWVTPDGQFTRVTRTQTSGGPTQTAGGLIALSDGSVIAGFSFTGSGSPTLGWGGTPIIGPASGLVRIDAIGNEAWSRKAGGDNAVLSTSGDGTFISSGRFTSANATFGEAGDPGGQVTLSLGGAASGFYLARYNLQGELLWVHGETGGDGSNSLGTAAAALPDGGTIAGVSVDGQLTFGAGEEDATTTGTPAGVDFALVRYFSYGP